jgi:hypothetical protein
MGRPLVVAKKLPFLAEERESERGLEEREMHGVGMCVNERERAKVVIITQ